MKTFTISCIRANGEHYTFNVFDYAGASCGTLTIRTMDVGAFVAKVWNGKVLWNGHIYEAARNRPKR